MATLEAYRAIFREKIQAHRGRVVDMAGDSVLAVFEAATGAVRWAVQLAGAERPRAIETNIILHVGSRWMAKARLSREAVE